MSKYQSGMYVYTPASENGIVHSDHWPETPVNKLEKMRTLVTNSIYQLRMMSIHQGCDQNPGTLNQKLNESIEMINDIAKDLLTILETLNTAEIE